MDTFTTSYKRRSPPPTNISTPTLGPGPLTPRGGGGIGSSPSPRGSPPSSSPVPFEQSHTVQASAFATAKATPTGLQSRSTKPKTGGGSWTPTSAPLNGTSTWTTPDGYSTTNGDTGHNGYGGGYGSYSDEPGTFVPAYGNGIMSDSERRTAESSKMANTASLPGSSRAKPHPLSSSPGPSGSAQGPYAYSTTLRRQVSLEPFPANLHTSGSSRRTSSRGPGGSFGSPRKRLNGLPPAFGDDDSGSLPRGLVDRVLGFGKRVWTGKGRDYESLGQEEEGDRGGGKLGGAAPETPSSIYAHKSIEVSIASYHSHRVWHHGGEDRCPRYDDSNRQVLLSESSLLEAGHCSLRFPMRDFLLLPCPDRTFSSLLSFRLRKVFGLT